MTEPAVFLWCPFFHVHTGAFLLHYESYVHALTSMTTNDNHLPQHNVVTDYSIVFGVDRETRLV
jgi:hypothetical protein